ncbi:hypothetical protein DERF_002279 [Dermatophagoides farinae]|uniref:Uncharacterized protein n=1 Tax=Dermatophagoides farinae TaxID=6954 RepID=A0A922LBV2_DERFA|nr:hypothetical protein DERF_002279 [Dermatophagoides farinae]
MNSFLIKEKKMIMIMKRDENIYNKEYRRYFFQEPNNKNCLNMGRRDRNRIHMYFIHYQFHFFCCLDPVIFGFVNEHSNI